MILDVWESERAPIDYFREFLGSSLARFERSTLPDHKGTRTVVLRLLKIITPVKCVIPLYNGYIPYPREGELYQKSRINVSESLECHIDKPRSYNYSSLVGPGLKLLWDT